VNAKSPQLDAKSRQVGWTRQTSSVIPPSRIEEISRADMSSPASRPCSPPPGGVCDARQVEPASPPIRSRTRWGVPMSCDWMREAVVKFREAFTSRLPVVARRGQVGLSIRVGEFLRGSRAGAWSWPSRRCPGAGRGGSGLRPSRGGPTLPRAGARRPQAGRGRDGRGEGGRGERKSPGRS